MGKAFRMEDRAAGEIVRIQNPGNRDFVSQIFLPIRDQVNNRFDFFFHKGKSRSISSILNLDRYRIVLTDLNDINFYLHPLFLR